MWDLRGDAGSGGRKAAQQVFCSRARDETRGLNLEEGRD